MKNGFKSIRKYSGKNISRIVFVTIILIIFLTIFLFVKFINGIDETIINISTNEIRRVTYSFITNKLNSSVFNNNSLNDILILEKNNKGEIIYVDFDLEQAYIVLDEVSKILTESFSALENGNITVNYLDKSLTHELGSMVLSIPIGNSFNNLYFYNFGPRIPVKVNFIGSVLTNLKTKVTNYGLNNALVEMFVYIEFNIQIMGPYKVEEVNLEYDAVIASMMVEGEVPSWYGGLIESQSNAYTKKVT